MFKFSKEVSDLLHELSHSADSYLKDDHIYKILEELDKKGNEPEFLWHLVLTTILRVNRHDNVYKTLTDRIIKLDFEIEAIRDELKILAKRIELLNKDVNSLTELHDDIQRELKKLTN
jgi:chaperonin cofactor prefoldin